MTGILKKTRLFVIISIFLSALSFWTTQKGWSEVYPFYFWKLYSQPAGWAKSYTSYRVYVKKEKNSSWTRLANRNRATFNRDETLYFLNPITQRIINSKSENNSHDLKKLKTFCEYIAPNYDHYKIVAETFNPLEIVHNSLKYDTLTVIQIP